MEKGELRAIVVGVEVVALIEPDGKRGARLPARHAQPGSPKVSAATQRFRGGPVAELRCPRRVGAGLGCLALELVLERRRRKLRNRTRDTREPFRVILPGVDRRRLGTRLLASSHTDRSSADGSGLGHATSSLKRAAKRREATPPSCERIWGKDVTGFSPRTCPPRG